MAFLGSLGSALGLGTAQSLVTEVTGSPTLGRVAGAASRGVSSLGQRLQATEQGQSTAVSIAPPPSETAFSGESGGYGMRPSNINFYGGMVQPASFRGAAPRVPRFEESSTSHRRDSAAELIVPATSRTACVCARSIGCAC